MTTYNLYSQDYIPCCFCGKLVCLYNATAHMKTKNCKTFQQLVDETERNKLLMTQKREINKLKSDLRLKED
jgi:phage FluMu protein Com